MGSNPIVATTLSDGRRRIESVGGTTALVGVSPAHPTTLRPRISDVNWVSDRYMEHYSEYSEAWYHASLGDLKPSVQI